MHQGHLRQEPQGLQTTQEKIPLEGHTDRYPSRLPTKSHYVFADVYTAIGKVYGDPTGRFVAPSISGNEYILVVYDYDSNTIFAEPFASRKTGSQIEAYETILSVLTSHGLTPKLLTMDNEVSKAPVDFLEPTTTVQLVPPHLHRRNADERAIQTFKSHFISILCGTNKHFPINLLDKLVPQATLTLNLLRTSRLNPNLSAYSQIFGSFDFNRTPIAPLGTKLLIHEKPGPRASWSPHAIDGWYIGPALRHYRCFRVWATATNAERIADTIVWFPEDYFMP